MNGDVVYLDSSAFVKLFLPEPDSRALMRHLASRPRPVSAMLLRTEALRTAVRAVLSPQRMLLVRAFPRNEPGGVHHVRSATGCSRRLVWHSGSKPGLSTPERDGRSRRTGRFEWTPGTRVRLAPPSSCPLRSDSAARAGCRRLCTRRCIPAQPQLVPPPASA